MILITKAVPRRWFSPSFLAPLLAAPLITINLAGIARADVTVVTQAHVLGAAGVLSPTTALSRRGPGQPGNPQVPPDAGQNTPSDPAATSQVDTIYTVTTWFKGKWIRQEVRGGNLAEPQITLYDTSKKKLYTLNAATQTYRITDGLDALAGITALPSLLKRSTKVDLKESINKDAALPVVAGADTTSAISKSNAFGSAVRIWEVAGSDKLSREQTTRGFGGGGNGGMGGGRGGFGGGMGGGRGGMGGGPRGGGFPAVGGQGGGPPQGGAGRQGGPPSGGTNFSETVVTGTIWMVDSQIPEADKKTSDAKAVAISLIPPVLPSGSIRKTLGERAEKAKSVPYALHLEFTRSSIVPNNGAQSGAAQTATLDARTESVRTDVLDEALFSLPANFKEVKEEKPQTDFFGDRDAPQHP